MYIIENATVEKKHMLWKENIIKATLPGELQF